MLRFRFALLAAALLAVPSLFVCAQDAPKAQESQPADRTSGKATIVPFRAGRIYSAELGRQKPLFSVESEFDKPAVDNPAWIELIVKLENGRTLSRFDYELVGKRETYPCYAVAESAEPYSTEEEKWIISKSSTTKSYRMLFPVNPSEFDEAKDGLLAVTLKLKLFNSSLPPAAFRVRVMPDREGFTPITKIRPEGLCNMSYHEAFEVGN